MNLGRPVLYPPVHIGRVSNEKVPSAVQLVTLSMLTEAGLNPVLQEYTYRSPNFRFTSAGTGTVFVPCGGVPHTTAIYKHIV